MIKRSPFSNEGAFLFLALNPDRVIAIITLTLSGFPALLIEDR